LGNFFVNTKCSKLEKKTTNKQILKNQSIKMGSVLEAPVDDDDDF
jgi:hypothetical protein